MNDLNLLGIDTSGNIASVAVCNENTVIAQTTVMTRLTHSQIILPLCKDVLEKAEMTLDDIDRIAVAVGPGSYTGLRIGISAVKGMCFGAEKECVGISTLEGLAFNMSGTGKKICSVMSARQNLVYTAFFEDNNGVITRISEDRIITEEKLYEEISEGTVIVGDYAKNFIEKFSGKNLLLAPPHLRYQLASSLCFEKRRQRIMIAIGCDHGGYELKLEIKKYLDEKGIEYKDVGCNGESCDYPDIAKDVCTLIQNGDAEKGILICGTGIGISIAANKHKGIRAALCTDSYMAQFTRLHNDSNVLCMGGRVIGGGVAVQITEAFLTTEFEGGRHQRRIDKISALEEN